jgi:hypothetical protein
VALEARVGLDVNEQVEVSRQGTPRAGVAAAGEADALAVLDPGRDLDVDRL